MQTVVQDYFNGLCCTEVITYNFDVDSSDWAGAGITDQASFESVLGFTTDQFILSGNNIKANITTVTDPLQPTNIAYKNLTNINFITISSISGLALGFNTISNFNPVIPLSNTLTYLSLDSNGITTFSPSIPLPSSLRFLFLENNQMSTSNYILMEEWANNLHNIPSGEIGQIRIGNNTDSVSGTNLEAILTSKGWTVII